MKDDRIDIVITWVDGNDPAWQKKRMVYKSDGAADVRPERYRDFGTLRFLLRSIEKFAPWAHHIYLVTDDQSPGWLIENDRLTVVDHRDFMPSEALPTFNSNAIEMNLHRIPGIAPKFIYFNDDMMLLSPTVEEDFFVGDRPVDMLALQPVVANPDNPVMTGILQSCALLLSRHFEKRANIRQQPGAYFHIGYPPMYFIYNMLELAFPLFTGFYTVHGPSALLAGTYHTIWEVEADALMDTTMHRFRGGSDVTVYIFREWEKLCGHFVPRNLHRMFGYAEITDDLDAFMKLIKRRPKTCCINDTSKPLSDYDGTRQRVMDELERIFPEKSVFEKSIL